jgi:hypothetical protein
VVVELVALGRLGPEERAAGVDEVRALVEVLLVDEEVLLLGADRRVDALGGEVAEQAQGPDADSTACPSSAAAGSSDPGPRPSTT